MARKDANRGQAAQAAERRIKAFEYHKRGASYRAIGAQLNISEAQAHRDVQAVRQHLTQLEQASAEEYRRTEEARLDDLALETWRVLQASHPLISGGKVLSGFTNDGKAIGLTDDGPKLAAIDRLLRISERRSKLRGLDAPVKIAPTNADGTPYQAYMELRTVVLAVLPIEQRLRLAEALEQVIDAADVDRPDDGA